MKKFLIVTNIIFLLAAAFFAYKYINGVKTDINTVGYGPDKSCQSKICKDYSNMSANGRINGFMADKLFNLYGMDDGKKFIYNATINTHAVDARSAWFSLDKVKKFIWDIEAMNCKGNCADSLGLRIYFAKYPDTLSPLWPILRNAGVPARYANHHTLFIVPTYNLNGVHFDFDPWKPGCRQTIDTLPFTNPNGIFLLGTGGGGDDNQNHGSLIPPDDPRGTIGGN